MWGEPERDALSDKMAVLVMTHIFYFMLCQSSLLNTVIRIAYKDKWCDSYLFHALSVFFIKCCRKLCIQRQIVV